MDNENETTQRTVAHHAKDIMLCVLGTGLLVMGYQTGSDALLGTGFMMIVWGML